MAAGHPNMRNCIEVKGRSGRKAENHCTEGWPSEFLLIALVFATYVHTFFGYFTHQHIGLISPSLECSLDLCLTYREKSTRCCGGTL